MTGSFEHDLEDALRRLADQSPPPPVDLTGRVRARAAARRRRRALVGSASVVACAAALLGVGLTVPRSPSATTTPPSSVGPATASVPSAAPSSSPAVTPWWPLTTPYDNVLPDFLTAFWDTRAHGPHTDVQVAHQDRVGDRLVLLLVGRRADGGLKLLADLPEPADAEAPLALAFGSGSASSIEVLAPPCSGSTRLTATGGGGLAATLRLDNTLALVSPQIGSVGLPYTMTITCDRAARSAQGTSFQITLRTSAVVTGNASVYLFSGQ